jgi:hypothetical protein
VKKIRLVADGRSHQQHGPTYSATLRREESLIIMHCIAALDYEYYHLGEGSAFWKAPNKNRDIKPTSSEVNEISSNSYLSSLSSKGCVRG